MKHLKWWQTRWFVVAAALAAAVPLLWPAIPPLVDVPGHIGAFRIMVEPGRPPLSHDYAFHWALIGNLGVDLLVYALHPLLDVEPATKLVVMLIPALTVAAMASVAREAHGELPATAAFAFPFAYALPFQLGFVNFALGGALALGGLALWLRLARTRAPWVRAAVFVPIACLIWLCHVFGWAMLGLTAFGADWVLRRERGEAWWRAGIVSALTCAPMIAPIAIKALIGGAALGGPTGDWFHWSLKLIWLLSPLRERWQGYDLACTIAVFAVIVIAWRSPRLRFEPKLGVPAVLAAITFILLPRYVVGGSYVDMRILPMAIAFAVLAIRVTPATTPITGRIAATATGFYALRLITSTIALALFAQGQVRALRPIGLFPAGSSVLTLTPLPGIGAWRAPRLDHIDGIAIARRRVFTNGQWGIEGQQLVFPTRPDAAPFDRDPSQLVVPDDTGDYRPALDRAIATFDRHAFDYVWTIDLDVRREQATGLTPIWSDGRSTVYRVERAAGT